MISFKDFFAIFVVVVAFTLIGMFLIRRTSENFKKYKLGYKLNEIRRNLEDVESKNFKLRLIYSTFLDTSYIVKKAKEKLNMHQAVPSQIIKIEEGGKQ